MSPGDALPVVINLNLGEWNKDGLEQDQEKGEKERAISCPLHPCPFSLSLFPPYVFDLSILVNFFLRGLI